MSATTTKPEADTVKIELDGGKYTYVLHPDRRQHALRHGELWRDLVGDKFVYSLAARAEELREQNDKLVEALRMSTHGLHRLPAGERCKCSQCDFVRARDAALTAAGAK